jgi:hypothetical protein
MPVTIGGASQPYIACERLGNSGAVCGELRWQRVGMAITVPVASSYQDGHPSRALLDCTVGAV